MEQRFGFFFFLFFREDVKKTDKVVNQERAAIESRVGWYWCSIIVKSLDGW